MKTDRDPKIHWVVLPDGSRCKCQQCYLRKKRYRIEYERGVRKTTSTERAREHLVELSKQGVGRRTVAKQIGVGPRALFMIKTGRAKIVSKEIEAKILSFQASDAALVANSQTVDATATKVRVQALNALGWTGTDLAQMMGRNTVGLDIRDRVTRKRALEILELCREIGMREGKSQRLKRMGKKHGWLVPDLQPEGFYDPEWDGKPLEESSRKEALIEDYLFLRETLGPETTTRQYAERMGVGIDRVRQIINQVEAEKA